MREADTHTPELEAARQAYAAAFVRSFSYVTGLNKARDNLLEMIGWHHLREVVIVAQQDEKDGPILLPDVIQQTLDKIFSGVPISPQSLAFKTDSMTVRVEPVDSLKAPQSEDQQFIFFGSPNPGIGKDVFFSILPNGCARIQIDIQDDRVVDGLSPRIIDIANFNLATTNAITNLLEETSRRVSSRVEIRQVRGFFGTAFKGI